MFLISSLFRIKRFLTHKKHHISIAHTRTGKGAAGSLRNDAKRQNQRSQKATRRERRRNNIWGNDVLRDNSLF